MPIIMSSTVGFKDGFYYVDLRELSEVFPHLSENKDVEIYLIEIRNEQNKLVKRFKPFRRLQFKTSTYYYQPISKWLPSLQVSEDISSQLGIGKNFTLLFIITKYDGKDFLPLEVRALGYDSTKVFEFLTKVEVGLLSLSQSIFNEAVSYLWDAWFRLEENDVEGARTATRNSLQVILGFLSKIAVSENLEESKEFPEKLRKVIINIREFLHYGGPHPGPAPRSTTELAISLTIEILKYLSKCIENKLFSLQEG